LRILPQERIARLDGNVDRVARHKHERVRFVEANLAVAIIVGSFERLAGARLSNDGGPKSAAVLTIVGFVDVGSAAGGVTSVSRCEEATAIANRRSPSRIGLVEDHVGESAR